MLGFTGQRKWVYPLHVTGRFQRIHRWSGRALFAFLLLTPWIPIGGHPAARIDLPARRVYALGATFTATDSFLVLLFLLLAAFALFFFTSLYGRLWCGYACPQTVFLEELIRPIERKIEGDRGQRMRRDQDGWTWDWIWRRSLKLVAFAGVAVVASMAFQSWFAGAPQLWTGAAGPVDYALVGAFSGVWFLDFAWFREQLCNYVCPYARFQGALTDDESQVVAYDVVRGEPRGGKDAKARGACIDCDKCVAVCPQGIDIRNGFQLECINCARCIDACGGVQTKLGHESLISYTTPSNKPPRWLRPRTVVYAGLLCAVSSAIVFLIATHQPFEATVSRAPGSLYTVDADGWVRNTYLVRLSSKSDGVAEVEVEVDGLNGAVLVGPDAFTLEPGKTTTVPLVVRVPPSADLPRTIAFEVRVSSDDAEIVRDATFKTPGAS